MKLSLIQKDGETIVRELSSRENRAVRRHLERIDCGHEPQSALHVIVAAHRQNLWFGCHCQPGGGPFPLAAPHRSKLGNFSLRVLIKNRPPHRRGCPLRREPSGVRFTDAWYRQPRKKPEGLFAVLKKKSPAGQAAGHKKPRGTGGTGGSGSKSSVSAASQQLLRLIDDAGLNSYGSASKKQFYSQWKKTIAQATKGKNIAPGRPLSALWFHFPRAWTRKAVHAQLCRAAKGWPSKHEPQAFICLLVDEIENQEEGLVHCDRGESVDLGCCITRREIYGHDAGGPYLLIGVAGKEGSTIQCEEAYAQPIVNKRIPIPVDSDYERRAFLSLLWRLEREKKYPGATFEIKKPLFERKKRLGPCTPDFLIHFRGGGPKVTVVLEVMGMDTSDYYRSKKETHPRMAEWGTLLLMDATRFPPRGEGLGTEGKDVFDKILAVRSASWAR